MTAPRRSGGSDANTRGIIVLVAAVVVGIILLAKTGGSTTKVNAGKAAGPSVTTTTLATTPDSTPASNPSTTTVASAHDRKVMKVLVLNANGGKSQATKYAAKLTGLGFNASPGPDPAQVPKSAVYYTPSYQADATAVATALGLDPSVVAPLPQTFPSAAAVASRAAKVVVVLGKDAPTI
ncbi:MAG: LytR cell envelope-related transcriptional attenuator [Acidimicrobiales bacterium]|nr:LytR cell envelope-related transcriptional attenuator [Acidimicrobiales bacterium]